MLFKRKEYDLDIKPLLRLVISRYFGNSVPCLVDRMVALFPCAEEAANEYVENYFLTEDGDQVELKKQIAKCEPSGPLCINVVCQFFDEASNTFGVYGRILSGTISQG